MTTTAYTTTTPAIVGRGTSVHALEGRWEAFRPMTVCGASYANSSQRSTQHAAKISQPAEVTCKRCVKALGSMSEDALAVCGVTTA